MLEVPVSLVVRMLCTVPRGRPAGWATIVKFVNRAEVVGPNVDSLDEMHGVNAIGLVTSSARAKMIVGNKMRRPGV